MLSNRASRLAGAVDLKAPQIEDGKIKTISARLDRDLPFEDSSFDFITMLAVLEHLDNPEAILHECARILRPGGGLLLTVPSWYAKPVLEFLAFKLRVVNPDEIRDHKRYFNREELFAMFGNVPGMEVKEHRLPFSGDLTIGYLRSKRNELYNRSISNALADVTYPWQCGLGSCRAERSED